MREGRPSATAQRVAARRLGFERVPAPYGDPSADEALARDVAGEIAPPTDELGLRYLRARTAFFDRVVVNAIGRGVRQIVLLGAGYDGRPLRYAREGVSWWEVDHPDTQDDKQARLARLGLASSDLTFLAHDLESNGLAGALLESGFEPDAPSLVCCEGVAIYLRVEALQGLLGEIRSLATPGTRLALSVSVEPRSSDAVDRIWRLRERLAELGEPAVTPLTVEEAGGLLDAARWRVVPTSERSRLAGLVLAAPVWAPAPAGAPDSIGEVARFAERMLQRSGGPHLGEHLEAVYGVGVVETREVDLGVHRVERADGSQWVARVFPAARPAERVEGDAELLEWLEVAGFPSERCAAPDPVSILEDQAVLVTEFVRGRHLPASDDSFSMLGQLLGRLHGRQPGCEAARRPGGAWHHLVADGTPSDEVRALATLLRDAAPRVPAGERARYDQLLAGLDDLDDGHDLPHAVVHPDFVPRNVIRTRDGLVACVDWAGSGWGPRVVSLGCLLWAASARGRRAVEAAVVGYRRELSLEEREIERLAGSVRIRPLVLAGWTFATGRGALTEVVDRWQLERKRLDSAADWTRRAFTTTQTARSVPARSRRH